MSITFVFGSNRDGQAGVASCEECLIRPTIVDSLANCAFTNIKISRRHSVVINNDGTIYNCGENDMGELGRNGKRSIFTRVDVLETVSGLDTSIGNGFWEIVGKDGSMYSWGVNSMGELGNGARDKIEKPKSNMKLADSTNSSVVAISSGSHHSIAVTKLAGIVSWGNNRKGQLGSDNAVLQQQYLSTSVALTTTANTSVSNSLLAKSIISLRHRPIAYVSCGEEFTLALTSTGLLYSFGDNTKSQLGVYGINYYCMNYIFFVY